jgi:Holliday junction resolvase RusA-like endonuclease
MITIELPFRPVGWKAPLGGKRRYPHPRYAAWKEEAILHARLQYDDEPLKGPIVIVVTVRVDGRRGDLTNYVKATEDALQAVRDGAGVFVDDRQVIEQHNYMVIDKDNLGITVEVRAVDTDAHSL